MTGSDADGRPTDAEVALAYSRIAHIYRTGGLDRLALDYFDVVAARFAHEPAIAARARAWAARCTVTIAARAVTRRRLRSVVRDVHAPPALRIHAAIRLSRLAPSRHRARTDRVLIQRLERDAPTSLRDRVRRRWSLETARRTAG